jgi:serine/threonine-protein kinase
VDLDSIARALNAGTLVRGTVEPNGDKLSVNIRLIDGNSGSEFDNAGLELPAGNLLVVRDSVAREVARLIQPAIGSDIRLQQSRAGTADVEAWSLVQQAEKRRKNADAAAARGDTLARNQGLAAADSLLAIAEQRDAKWIEPVIGRALVSYRRSRLFGRGDIIHPYLREGLAHIERALALDRNNADALELRGNLRYWGWLQGIEPDAEKASVLLAGARKDLEDATAKNPNQAGAWASLTHLYNQTATGTDVALAARRALEADAFLDQAAVILFRLFISSYDLSQFTQADDACKEIRRRFPADMNAPRCELFMLTSRIREPDPARAWRLADSVAEAAGNRRQYFELNAHMLVAAVLAKAGQRDSAAAVIERSKGNPDINPTRDLALFGAFAYAVMDNREKAVELLGVYLQANPRLRAVYAEDAGWWFRPIAEDPAFKRLVGPVSN